MTEWLVLECAIKCVIIFSQQKGKGGIKKQTAQDWFAWKNNQEEDDW